MYLSTYFLSISFNFLIYLFDILAYHIGHDNETYVHVICDDITFGNMVLESIYNTYIFDLNVDSNQMHNLEFKICFINNVLRICITFSI